MLDKSVRDVAILASRWAARTTTVCVFFALGSSWAAMNDEVPPKSEIGLEVGQEMPFHVADFKRASGRGGGCPSVIISNRRTHGVIVWARTADDAVLRLAKSLDEQCVDGGRFLGFVVGFDRAGDELLERADASKNVTLCRARQSADRALNARGVAPEVQTLVFFLDRKKIRATWEFKANELSNERIAEIVARAKEFRENSFPVLASLWSGTRLGSGGHVTIPVAFPAVDNRPRMGRVFRREEDLAAAIEKENKTEERDLLLKRLGRKVDWSQEMLIAISGGDKPVGTRYVIVLDSVEKAGTELVITYEVAARNEDAEASAEGVKYLAVVPRFDGDVRFVKKGSP